jgi:hypothetical protein
MDFLEWKVPIDDERHWNVHKVLVHLTGEEARRWQERRAADIASRDLEPTDLMHQMPKLMPSETGSDERWWTQTSLIGQQIRRSESLAHPRSNGGGA